MNWTKWIIILVFVLLGTAYAQQSFTDNFSDGDMTGWLAVSDAEWSLYPTIQDGACHIAFNDPDTNMIAMFSPIGAVNEFSFEINGRSSGAGAFATGLFVISAEGNVIQYHVIEGNTLQLVVANLAEGDWDVLFETEVNTSDDNYHSMKLEAAGVAPTITVSIWWDDALIHTEQLTEVPVHESGGQIGFFAYGNEVDMQFDDVIIQYTPLYEGNNFTDNFSDGDMTGWLAVSDAEWSLYPTIQDGACHIAFNDPDTNMIAMFSPIGAVNEFSFEINGRSSGAGAFATGLFVISAEGNVIQYHVIEGNTLQLVVANLAEGDWDVLFETEVNTSDDNYHSMKLEAAGVAPTITVSIWWDAALIHTEQLTEVPVHESGGQIGFFAYGDEVDMTYDNIQITYISPTTIKSTNAQPTSFILENNYPNPFNPSTTINYTLPIATNIDLTIYSISGCEITNIVSGNQLAGVYNVQWNGTNHSGNKVGTGVYFARLQAGSVSKTIKMIYLK